jgi:hypothetical protein
MKTLSWNKAHFSDANELLFIVCTDTVVSSSCCTSLDSIVTYLFKHIAKEGKKPLGCREAVQAGQRLLHFMQQNPDVLQQVIQLETAFLRNQPGPGASLPCFVDLCSSTA